MLIPNLHYGSEDYKNEQKGTNSMRYRLDDLNAWWSREYNTLPEVKEAASKRIEKTDGDCVLLLRERNRRTGKYEPVECFELPTRKECPA